VAELVVLTGPPGAGKSTVSRLLARELTPSALVEGDAFFAFLARGAVAPWLPEAHAQNEVVLGAAAAAAGRFVTGGVSVVYDGVVGPWSLPAFTAATGLAQLHYAVLLPSQERCVARVASRSGHGFTDASAARAMHRDFATAAVAARHVLADPPDEPAAVAAAVLERLAAGALLHRGWGVQDRDGQSDPRGTPAM
jgi:energy-coupling factor transporter ATP-binding protein EcfA2